MRIGALRGFNECLAARHQKINDVVSERIIVRVTMQIDPHAIFLDEGERCPSLIVGPNAELKSPIMQNNEGIGYGARCLDLPPVKTE